MREDDVTKVEIIVFWHEPVEHKAEQSRRRYKGKIEKYAQAVSFGRNLLVDVTIPELEKDTYIICRFYLLDNLEAVLLEKMVDSK